jgi:hypothetical protein
MKKKKKKTVELTCFDLKWSTGQGRRERERERNQLRCAYVKRILFFIWKVESGSVGSKPLSSLFKETISVSLIKWFHCTDQTLFPRCTVTIV